MKAILKYVKPKFKETFKLNDRPIININLTMNVFDEVKAVEKYLEWCAEKGYNPDNFAVFYEYKRNLIYGTQKKCDKGEE